MSSQLISSPWDHETNLNFRLKNKKNTSIYEFIEGSIYYFVLKFEKTKKKDSDETFIATNAINALCVTENFIIFYNLTPQ